jgi:2-dehydropantoate 2-reductase
MKDTIYIIGAGAIGKALAVFLKLEGRNVVLLRASIDDEVHYYESIEIEMPDGSRLSASVEVSSLSNFDQLYGLVILTNKTYGNERLSKLLTSKIVNAPIVLLQNGLGVEEAFIGAGFNNIFRSVLFVSCQLLSDNLIRYKPADVSPVGLIKGNHEDLMLIIKQVSNPFFLFKASDDIQTVIWTKAMINCVFNSVCPLLETDNGIFFRNEQALAIAKEIIGECITIANLKGIYPDFEAVIERLLLISKSSDGQLISTYMDILNKRNTEIESLNFAIGAIAGELGKKDTVKETKLLGDLVKIKSDLVMI